MWSRGLFDDSLRFLKHPGFYFLLFKVTESNRPPPDFNVTSVPPVMFTSFDCTVPFHCNPLRSSMDMWPHAFVKTLYLQRRSSFLERCDIMCVFFMLCNSLCWNVVRRIVQKWSGSNIRLCIFWLNSGNIDVLLYCEAVKCPFYTNAVY